MIHSLYRVVFTEQGFIFYIESSISDSFFGYAEAVFFLYIVVKFRPSY